MDRRIKNKRVHDQLGKRVGDQNWADYDEEEEQEEEEEEEYVWQDG